jgi:protein-S-isoprenylcysteine O-methyltransferase Ste14
VKLFLKNLLFTLLVPGTVTVWLPYAWFWKRNEFHSPIWISFAVTLIVVGTAIYLRCVWDFAAGGRGTPAPIDPPKALVVRGLYRYVRNPMYLGVLLVLMGEALIFPSRGFLLYILAFFSLVNVFIILYEEPRLHRQFGESYGEYRRAVPRWIPGLRKTKEPSSRPSRVPR